MKRELKLILKALDAEGLLIEIRNPLNINMEKYIISGTIKTDTKRIASGDIFACIKGFHVDGHSFVNEAISKGSSIIVSEYIQYVDITQIIVNNTRLATAVIARCLYDNPSQKIDLIGVTGTNGKTTTTFILEQLYTEMGYKTGLIGTLGYKIGNEMFQTEHTTPDIVELNEILYKMSESGCQIVIMEVSSHALALERVYGLSFKVGIFTNLSQDHLDFHADMNEYGWVKYKLFEMVAANNGICIINTDDEFGKIIFQKLNCKKIKYYMNEDNLSGWRINDIRLSPDSSQFNLQNKDHTFLNIKSSIIGKFNIYNLTAALITVATTTLLLKNNLIKSESQLLQEFVQLLHKIDKIKPIKGRIEKIENDQNLDIFVDYAHTPDALATIIDTVREFTRKRVICVWGCGGNRDKDKRAKMALISIEKADLTIITNDNPRLEFPADIIRDIIQPLKFEDSYFIIRDRDEAIKAAVILAQSGDAVIIAGKGHETYQEIGNVKYKFDDRKQIEKHIRWEKKYRSSNSSSNKQQILTIPIDLLNIEKLLNKPIRNNHLQDNLPLFRYVSTDSRNINTDTLFFALKGENFDGADFVDDVIKKSRDNWCVINNEVRMNNSEYNEFYTDVENNKIYVDDTIKVYGKLAQKYLKLFGAKIIAITGSTGKTTTKEILWNILSTDEFACFKSHENENNKIGVPKNIFKMRSDYRYAIFEIGTSQPGEIAYLADILQPYCGGVISVGAAHLELLGSIEEVFNEKISLLEYIKEFAVIEENIYAVEHVAYISRSRNHASLRDTFELKKLIVNDEGIYLEINNIGYQTCYKIPYLAKNAVFAITIAKLLGLDFESIQNGLQKELKIDNRMEIIKSENRTILWDCYNANPTSMKAAIKFWKSLEPEEKHIAILGDMLELGSSSEMYHEEIADLLKEIENKTVIGIGYLAKLYKPTFHYNNVDEFIDDINRFELDRGIILVKGSNSVNLDRINFGKA